MRLRTYRIWIIATFGSVTAKSQRAESGLESRKGSSISLDTLVAGDPEIAFVYQTGCPSKKSMRIIWPSLDRQLPVCQPNPY
jgi:hypothetical protein